MLECSKAEPYVSVVNSTVTLKQGAAAVGAAVVVAAVVGAAVVGAAVVGAAVGGIRR